jgi:hypothetical protein
VIPGSANLIIGLDKSVRSGWGILLSYQYVGFGTFNKDKLDGHGMQICGSGKFRTIYDGDFKDGNIDGSGSLTFDTGFEYKGNIYHVVCTNRAGQWNNNKFHGLGSVKYSDGTRYEGQWKRNKPEFDARHPTVKECIKNGLCTNTLPEPIPQKMYEHVTCFVCEYCHAHCGNFSMMVDWSFVGARCGCIYCNKNKVMWM